MTEKRYVVKSREDHYYTGSSSLWHTNMQLAKIFDNSEQILRETSWMGYSYPSIVEVERVPQPEWREVREL